MIRPAHPATQKVGRAASTRSYKGCGTRRCRSTNQTPAPSAVANRIAAVGPLSGAASRLIPSTRAPTISTETIPLRLSTGSVLSLTCAGTSRHAITSATTASGRVSRKTEPHQKWVTDHPAARGPSTANAAPMPDHSAIARVRAGPTQSAEIRARVVGKAMPAQSPPPSRATKRTSVDGAHAATRLNGIVAPVPMSSIRRRP